MFLFQNETGIDTSKCKYSDETFYSISRPEAAEFISSCIRKLIPNCNEKSILDATAHVGGNTLNFAKYFKNVLACEIQPEYAKMLKHNISLYHRKNVEVIQDDCIEIMIHKFISVDVVFIDPPWGGKEYKNKPIVSFSLQNQKLSDVVKHLINENKSVILKLPLNYDTTEFIDICARKYNLVFEFKKKSIFLVLIFLPII